MNFIQKNYFDFLINKKSKSKTKHKLFKNKMQISDSI